MYAKTLFNPIPDWYALVSKLFCFLDSIRTYNTKKKNIKEYNSNVKEEDIKKVCKNMST
jgi:hypothetical protein